MTFFLLFGVLSWVWLVREMLRRDGFVDAPRWVCTGCAKGRMPSRRGCRMRKREWIAFVLFLSVLVSGIYMDSAFASHTSSAEWNARPVPYTMAYLGRPLHCLVVEDGAEAGNIGALSCDFARFWRGRK